MINSGCFNERDLVKLPRKPMLSKVWIGNKVMLASGGPDMTVMNIDENDNIECWWTCNKSGITYKHIFDLSLLTCAGAK